MLLLAQAVRRRVGEEDPGGCKRASDTQGNDLAKDGGQSQIQPAPFQAPQPPVDGDSASCHPEVLPLWQSTSVSLKWVRFQGPLTRPTSRPVAASPVRARRGLPLPSPSPYHFTPGCSAPQGSALPVTPDSWLLPWKTSNPPHTPQAHHPDPESPSTHSPLIPTLQAWRISKSIQDTLAFQW